MASAFAGVAAMSEQSKMLTGAIGIVIGVVLIGLMTFGDVGSETVKVALGVVGVLATVVGTVLFGISEDREQIV